MIIFLSDLHLEGGNRRQTVDFPRLKTVLLSVRDNAVRAGVKRLKLLLAGDTFELLNHPVWTKTETGAVKPWHGGERVKAAFKTIADEVVRSNGAFFALMAEFGHPITLLAGNHDWALTNEEGSLAWRQIQSAMPDGTTMLRSSQFRCEEHNVLAIHGHEWDRDNYSVQRSSGQVPFGDALVVELIASVPAALAEKWTDPGLKPVLASLFELDNVRPQTPKAMAQWIELSLSTVKAKHRGEVETIIGNAVSRLEKLDRSKVRLTQPVSNAKFATKLVKPLRLMSWLDHAADKQEFELERAREEFIRLPNLRYLVAGHTHTPIMVPIANANRPGAKCLYFNTGAWRRVHRRQELAGKAPRFETWDEGCLVVIYSPQEQIDGRLPAYEFIRSACGAV